MKNKTLKSMMVVFAHAILPYGLNAQSEYNILNADSILTHAKHTQSISFSALSKGALQNSDLMFIGDTDHPSTKIDSTVIAPSSLEAYKKSGTNIWLSELFTMSGQQIEEKSKFENLHLDSLDQMLKRTRVLSSENKQMVKENERLLDIFDQQYQQASSRVDSCGTLLESLTDEYQNIKKINYFKRRTLLKRLHDISNVQTQNLTRESSALNTKTEFLKNLEDAIDLHQNSVELYSGLYQCYLLKCLTQNNFTIFGADPQTPETKALIGDQNVVQDSLLLQRLNLDTALYDNVTQIVKKRGKAVLFYGSAHGASYGDKFLEDTTLSHLKIDVYDNEESFREDISQYHQTHLDTEQSLQSHYTLPSTFGLDLPHAIFLIDEGRVYFLDKSPQAFINSAFTAFRDEQDTLGNNTSKPKPSTPQITH